MKHLLPALALWLATCGTAHARGPILVTSYIERGRTADGTWAGPGVAACPAWLAMTTRVAIEGIGVVTCHDRYYIGLSDRFDVWMPTVSQAYAVTGWRRYWLLGGGDFGR